MSREHLRAIPESGAISVRPVPVEWDETMPVFAHAGFLGAVGDQHGWLGGVDAAGTIRCILPYTIVRKAGVRMVRFRVQTIARVSDLPIDEERAFLSGVVAHLRRAGADAIIPASTNTIFRTYPEAAVAAPYGTHLLALDRPDAELWNGMSANHRRQVRAAEKAGVRVRVDAGRLAEVHGIIRETFAKSSRPFMSARALTAMVEGLGEHAHVFVAEVAGRVQSCAVMAFSTYSAYYMYGGSIPAAAPGSMHLLHWEAIRRYLSAGVERYDFCGARVDPPPGSKAEGLATFKQRFGSEFRVGYMWKCSLSPIRAALYTAAVRWMRGGDIVDAERHKMTPAVAPVSLAQGPVAPEGRTET